VIRVGDEKSDEQRGKAEQHKTMMSQGIVEVKDKGEGVVRVTMMRE